MSTMKEDVTAISNDKVIITGNQNRMITSICNLAIALMPNNDYRSKKKLLMMKNILLETVRECDIHRCPNMWLHRVFDESIIALIVDKMNENINNHPEIYLTESMLQEHYEECINIARCISKVILKRYSNRMLVLDKALKNDEEITE